MNDEVVLKSARNAFLVLILALLGVGLYQIAMVGSVTPVIGGIWLAGVVAFYGSKVYYGRS